MPEGDYSVTVTDAEGCTIEISALLPNLTPLISLPNTFSPNSDGLNDEFKAVYNCETTLFEMYIYNRWGSMVFQTKNIGQGWDGTYQGEVVPEGVYFYQLIFNKEYQGSSFTEIQKGNLRIVR